MDTILSRNIFMKTCRVRAKCICCLSRVDLQQEETGTLMANTIHTMSMRLRQMVTRDSGESKVGPELLSGVEGSWVVAGTCWFR